MGQSMLCLRQAYTGVRVERSEKLPEGGHSQTEKQAQTEEGKRREDVEVGR